MKKTILLAVAAASLFASPAAFAQVSVGVPGIGGVTVGEPGYRDGYRYRDREYRRSYNYDRGYDRGDRVVIRKERRMRDYDRGYRRTYIERD